MGATQVVEPVAEPEAPPQRGSALAAVAIMAGIALVAAALVVAWARVGGGSETSAESDIIDAEPPVSLAGATEFGEVPPVIAAAVEAPVVGALRLERLPADLEGCGDDFGVTDARLESAIITPDAAVVAVVGTGENFGVEFVPRVPVPAPGQLEQDGTESLRAECLGSWDGGWSLTGWSALPVGQVEGDVGGIVLSDNSPLSISSLLVPEGATWLVHDRGGYRLAYPVSGLPVVTVTRPNRQTGAFGPAAASSTALFLDDAGTVLEETFVGG